jgi:hypothetical protein
VSFHRGLRMPGQVAEQSLSSACVGPDDAIA